MRGFVLDPLAEEDLKEAANHYETQVTGLGDDFLDEVFAVIQRLIAFPESGSRKTKIVRVARVRRFPYDVLYKIEKDLDRIFVLAISDQRRKPGWWKKRL